jgi:hypothetical protein
MSKSTLKLKHFEILNLTNYFQQLNDDILQEEEDIVDIIYETSEESKFIFNFLLLLSRGSLIYLEYNTTTKKVTKLFKNSVLSSIITNEIQCCELSFSSPMILSTSLNELILVDTKDKPCQLINITEENITLYSAYCDNTIIDIKFNCNQSIILVTTLNQILIYKMISDKLENKPILQMTYEIKLVGLDLETSNQDFSTLIDTRYFPKFSDFSENILHISYISEEAISNTFTKVTLDNEDVSPGFFYLNIIAVHLNKKDYQMKMIKSFCLEKSLIKICSTYFYEKLFFLYKDGIICCVNSSLLSNTSSSSTSKIDDVYDSKLIFKYPLSTSVKFCDIYFHPSSNFIVVKDTQNDYLIFDFTLNLYYIMHNSKITVKLNMNSLDKESRVKQVAMKSYEIHYNLKNAIQSGGGNKIYNQSQNSYSNKLSDINDFRIDKNIQKIIYSGKLNNNSMFFYDSRCIHGIFIEISSIFNQTNNLNPLLDEFQLLKNHLRGQNFDSSFKILMMIQNFNLWLQALLLIVNKLCHNPNNILMLKKHSLANALNYLKYKSFDDEAKTATVNNIKIICFTNLLYRCLSIKQYEYAFLIADKLAQPFMYKLIVSHSRQNKFLGISYLACNKLESDNSTNGENEESIISDINKIITSSNFVLSQTNMQQLVKDVDQLLENNNLNSEYMKENNSLEINLQSKLRK